MLGTIERRIVFGLFCAFATLCVISEIYIGISLLDKELTVAKGLVAFFNASVLVAIGFAFKELIKRNFLRPSIMSMKQLHRWASERCNIIGKQSVPADQYKVRQELIGSTLAFAEDILRNWMPGSHFELCVFIDQEYPILFSYFDSNHDSIARTMKERDKNPKFYVEKGYEVTKLLQNPTSQPRLIKDTHDVKIGYVFATEEQRRQLRSSILLCLDLNTPCALVISSNEKNAFPETDPEVMSFIRFVGEQVRYDLFEGGFIDQIRKLRPHAFPNQPLLLEAVPASDPSLIPVQLPAAKAGSVIQ